MKPPAFPGGARPRRPISVSAKVGLPPKKSEPLASIIDDARRFTAGSRRRRRVFILTGGGILSLVLLVTGIVFSPLLTLTEVVVKGREFVPERVIVGAVSDQVGKPLAAIDFAAIQSKLSSVTRIQSFTTEIQPPHTLVIRVVERVAIGFLSSKSKWVVIDAAGVVIDTVTTTPSKLPHIVVASTTDRAFPAVTETLLALPQSVRKRIAVISAETRDSVRFTLRGEGHEIVWGSSDNAALKSLVMDRALRVASRNGGRYEIDVSAPDNIVLQPIR